MDLRKMIDVLSNIQNKYNKYQNIKGSIFSVVENVIYSKQQVY